MRRHANIITAIGAIVLVVLGFLIALSIVACAPQPGDLVRNGRYRLTSDKVTKGYENSPKLSPGLYHLLGPDCQYQFIKDGRIGERLPVTAKNGITLHLRKSDQVVVFGPDCQVTFVRGDL